MSLIGTFKAQSQVGTFKFKNSLEGLHLRNKVEKFVAHNPISNTSWDAYCEYRAVRELGHLVNTEEEAQAFDVLWDEFYNSVNENGASKFALGKVVENMVLRIDPWAP